MTINLSHRVSAKKLRPTKAQLFKDNPIRKAPPKFKGSGTLERSVKVKPTKSGIDVTSNWVYAGKVDRTIGISKTGKKLREIIVEYFNK